MEVMAKMKYVRSSAQKIRLIVNLIRGKKVNYAFNVLKYINKKSSFLVNKLLKSVVSNATNNYNIDIDFLRISKIYVDGASSIKRMVPRAKGRVNYILKRTSHITIFVSNS